MYIFISRVAMESGSFLKGGYSFVTGCCGKWQSIKRLLWKYDTLFGDWYRKDYTIGIKAGVCV